MFDAHFQYYEGVSLNDATTTARHNRVRSMRAVWAVAIVFMLAVAAAGGVLAANMPASTPAHDALDVRFSTTSLFGGAEQRDTIELWTDAVKAQARLYVTDKRITLYYMRDDAGTWYSVGRASPRAPWRRTTLSARGAPALLSLEGVRALFGRLRRRAAHVTWTGLHRRLAVAFPVTVLSWPFYYSGRATVWLDGVSGLPVQIRTAVADGTTRGLVITTVDIIRSVPSSTLPIDYLTPPNQAENAWGRIAGRVAEWFRHSFRG